MTGWQAALLGVVQGLTEFLPVSSSGHLALVQRLLPGFHQPGIVFDVALHLGTALAVVVLEWQRLLSILRDGRGPRLVGQLLLATAVTAVIALPLRESAERAFDQPLVVAAGLALTAFLLLLPLRGRRSTGLSETGWGTVAFIGLVQGAAAMPGISRSGATIVAGLAGGMERRWAAEFSFLLSVPAILGASVVEGWVHRGELVASAGELVWPCLAGAGTAALTGLVAMLVVRRLVVSGRLRLFAYYLLPLAALVVVLHGVSGW